MAQRQDLAGALEVLFVINSLAPGGTEQSTLLLAERLMPLGVRTTVVTLKSAPHQLNARAESSGIPVVELLASGFLGKLRELRALIRARRPAVVHTALFDADQLGRLAAWGTGVPVISSLVSTPYDPARLGDPMVSRWRLRLVQVVDAVTGRLCTTAFHSVSEGVKRSNAEALHLPIGRIHVAERGRDMAELGGCSVERRSRVRSSLGIDDSAPVLLNLGRQEHQKAQSDLIAATGLLVGRFPEIVLLIAGKEGSATSTLANALDQTPDAAKHVRLLGHRTDIGDLLCAADVLAISSHLEGTAGVALEAMALGTPVLSTRLRGLEGILEHDVNAWLVPAAQPVALADGVAELLENQSLRQRLADRGLQDFDDRFTLDAAAERMARLYEEVSRSPR